MKILSSKVLLIIGLIIGFGSPIFVGCIAFAFPNIPADYTMLITYFFACFSVVLFTLSLAKKRMENGSVQSNSLARALTPAQISLMAAASVLFLGVVFGVFVSEAMGGFAATVGFNGVVVSIVFAVIRGARKRNERKAKKPVRTIAVSPTVFLCDFCERCGTAADKGTLKELNGHKFCGSCMEIMLAAQSSEILAEKAKCCICGNEYEKSKMIFVDDQYICDCCFRKLYAGSTPVADNTEDL